jgi:hypothetical protein
MGERATQGTIASPCLPSRPLFQSAAPQLALPAFVRDRVAVQRTSWSCEPHRTQARFSAMLIPITSRDVSRVMGPHRHRELGPAAVRRTGASALMWMGGSIAAGPQHTRATGFPPMTLGKRHWARAKRSSPARPWKIYVCDIPDRARTIERRPSVETRGRTAPRLGGAGAFSAPAEGPPLAGGSPTPIRPASAFHAAAGFDFGCFRSESQNL